MDFIGTFTIVLIHVHVPETELLPFRFNEAFRPCCLAQYGLAIRAIKVINSVFK